MGLNASDYAAAGGLAGLGILWLVIVAILIANGIFWFFLPFVLISKLNEMIRRLKSIEAESEAIARNTRPEKSATPESSVHYER